MALASGEATRSSERCALLTPETRSNRRSENVRRPLAKAVRIGPFVGVSSARKYDSQPSQLLICSAI